MIDFQGGEEEEEGEGESGSGEEEEDEDGSAIEPEADGLVDDSALANLENFINGLDTGRKRKFPDGIHPADVESEEPRKQKRRVLQEQTLLGAESEFAAPTGG